jgi:hypothetical protein
MAGMTFSDRWVAKTRRGPGQLYWLKPARLMLLAVLASLLGFGIAFAVGLATKTSSHAVKLSPAAAVVTHSSSSAVKISAKAPAISIPAMAKAPVHHVTHTKPVVASSPPPVRVTHTVTTPVNTAPPVTHPVPTPTVPTPTVPTRTQAPPSGGTTTGGGTGTVTGGG